MKKTLEMAKRNDILRKYIQRGKREEVRLKVERFLEKSQGFTIKHLTRAEYKYLFCEEIFWSDLAFKEINVESTKASKKINKIIKYTRKKGGKVFYSCITKNKLGFLIPKTERMVVTSNRGIKHIETISTYWIVIL